jgi:hypothetical protein
MKSKPELRNNQVYDGWSLVHFLTGILLGWLVNPVAGIIIMVLWEPLEILILSPLLKKFGIVFGYETFKNSVSDIVADSLGILIGYYLIRLLLSPPLSLF